MPIQTAYDTSNADDKPKIEKLMVAGVNEDKWLVMWDQGEIKIVIGDSFLVCTFVPIREVDEALSYCWGTEKVKTWDYAISTSLLKMRFQKKTWVDAISHFGIPSLLGRTLKEMGSIYRKIPVRPEWIERKTLLDFVLASTRMWIWQVRSFLAFVGQEW